MDRISLCVRVVAERVPLMKNIFTVECRNSLSSMLDANKRGEEEKMNKVHLIYVTCTRECGPNQRELLTILKEQIISLKFNESTRAAQRACASF